MEGGSLRVRRELLKPFETVMLVSMQRQVHILFENYLKRHLDGKNYFAVESTQVTAEGEIGYHFLRLEQYMFCITITEFCSLACKVAELNPFPNTLNKDRNRWKQMVLQVQETTPTTKSEAATC
jgi:hypothetical protein